MKMRRVESWSIVDQTLVGSTDTGPVRVAILDRVGKTVRTEEGTFLLGQPNSTYVAWLESQGQVLDL